MKANPIIKITVILLLIDKVFAMNSIEVNKSSIGLSNEGIFGGKINSEIRKDNYIPLNNHGYFYNKTYIEYSYNKTITLNTNLRVLNDELSSLENYKLCIEPEFKMSLQTNRTQMNIQGGYINDITIGEGLTVKNMSNSGAVLTINKNKMVYHGGIFTKGYGENEDIYWIGLTPIRIPIKIVALIMNTQSSNNFKPFTMNRYYISGYLLNSIKIYMPGTLLYGEYGLKLNKKRDVDGIIEKSAKIANAGMFGIKVDKILNKITLNGCTELRIYQKGFVPVTGVKIARFDKFWNEADSRNNWIDFFDSRETSYWIYLKFNIDWHFNNYWNLFINNEMLMFYSNQDEAIVYNINEGAIVKYKPSTNFYRVGIRFDISQEINVEMYLSNKLINYTQGTEGYFTQWGQRFVANKEPYFEVRLEWKY